uniref:Carboxylic ester hydrolase n=1 Tax=Esox lucius TaxID=8010 RepID=A0AAY5KN97_ESOLU
VKPSKIIQNIAKFLEMKINEGGMVKGKNHGMGFLSGRSVDVFKGIPFADPPERFEKPKPHRGWDGVLNAYELKERCLQVTLMQSSTHGSKDFLYLNIFVPQNKVSMGLPVMVYLFGGAFLLRASNDVSFLGNSLYNGKEIADRGKVIIVTVNYRVGVLGFLSTGDSNAPGNYGLWDQHAAIAWVHRNIQAFGGAKENITVFGQSAGAASVNFQMLSPYNKGLFRWAISQCGTALSPWALQTNPLPLANKIAEKVGCATDEQMMTCLKITEPVALTLSGHLCLDCCPRDPLLEHAPVVDGDFVPEHPSKLFHNAANIDYLAGVNSMDGHLFAGVDVPSINKNQMPTTSEEIKELLAGLTKHNHWSTVNLSIPSLSIKYYTGARTYSYLFNMGNRIPGFPSWVEAEHEEDVQYVFGKPFDTPLGYFPRHRTLSEYMISYWTNFARTGDPNQGVSKVPTTWPEFSCSEHPYLVINNKIKKSSIKHNLRSQYVKYWTSTYASLPYVEVSLKRLNRFSF